MNGRSTADWYHLLRQRKAKDPEELSGFMREQLLGMGFVFGCGEDSMAVYVKEKGKSGKAVLLYVDVTASQALYACAVALSVCSRYAEASWGGGRLGLLFASEALQREAALSLQFEYLIGLSFSEKLRLPENVGTPYVADDAMSKLSFEITGLTAHGSAPHLGINSLDAAALAVTAAQMAAGCLGGECQVIPAYMDTGKGAINMIPDHTHLVLRIYGREERMDRYRIAVEEAVKQAVTAVGASVRCLPARPMLPAGKYRPGRACQVLSYYMEKYYGRANVVPVGYCMGVDFFHRYREKHQCDAAYLGRPVFSESELKIRQELSTCTDVIINTVQWLEKEGETDG